MIKKIAINTLIYSVAPYVPSFANLLVLPLITKELTEVDYGISGTIIAYTSALSALSVLGLSVILNNSFFNSQNWFKYIWRQLYGFLIFWNFIYSIGLGAFLYFFMPNAAIENRVLIVLLNTIPIAFFGPTLFFGTSYYTLKQEALPIGVRTAFFGLMAVVLNLVFIIKFKYGYMGWFYTNFIVGVLTNLSYWYVLNRKLNIKPIYNFKLKTIKKSLSVSLPLLPHQYSYYLLSGSERLIMDQLKIDTGKIGEFNIAASFSNYVSNFAQAGSTAIAPVLMNLYRENRYLKARNVVFFYQFVLLLLNFIICLWIKEAFFILINNEVLRKTYDIAIILIMSVSFSPLFSGYFSLLTYKERTKNIWTITFIAGVLCVLLNVLFLPKYGVFSSAIIIFIAYAYRGISGYYLKSFKGISGYNYYPLFWTFLIVIFTIIVFLLKDYSLPFKGLLTFTIISVSFFLYLIKEKLIVKFNAFCQKPQE